MPKTMGEAYKRNFLGQAPNWYKLTILAFLVANPILMFTVGPYVTGWILIGEFIFTLAMALKCYPLPAGGLLAIEAVLLGLTTPQTVYNESLHNFPVIMLLMFMVAGIYFMKEMLQFVFTKLLLGVKSKATLSLLFCFAGAFLSAFLDALTVTAVIITVAYGFYDIYHRFASGKHKDEAHDCRLDGGVEDCHRNDLEQFRAFLRNLMMHGAVGTALGGVCTLVGEPQNLLIGHELGWHFPEFFVVMMPVTMPVLAVGLLTCYLLETRKLFGYGAQIPPAVREILEKQAAEDDANRTYKGKARLVMQAVGAVILVVCLGLHVAEVGVIGLGIIIFLTAMCGVTEEHSIGHAFEEALPFTALLVVFFAVVGVIHDQHLFKPIIQAVLAQEGQAQLVAYYLANGILSAISDNVFVATVYVSETKLYIINQLSALPGVEDGYALMRELVGGGGGHGGGHGEAAGHATHGVSIFETLPAASQQAANEIMHQFDRLAVAINTGTNIPSVATPNGQAAFLFLLTSALSPVIRLSYIQMVKLAAPYTVTMSITGLAAVYLFL